MMPLIYLPVGLVSVSAALKQWSDNPDSVAIKTFSKPAREAIQSHVTSKPSRICPRLGRLLKSMHEG